MSNFNSDSEQSNRKRPRLSLEENSGGVSHEDKDSSYTSEYSSFDNSEPSNELLPREYDITNIFPEISRLLNNSKTELNFTNPVKQIVYNLESYFSDLEYSSSSLEHLADELVKFPQADLDLKVIDIKHFNNSLKDKQKARVLYGLSRVATFFDFIACLPTTQQNVIFDQSFLRTFPFVPMKETISSLGLGHTFTNSNEVPSELLTSFWDDISLNAFIRVLMMIMSSDNTMSVRIDSLLQKLRSNDPDTLDTIDGSLLQLFAAILPSLCVHSTGDATIDLNAILTLALDSKRTQAPLDFPLFIAWQEYQQYIDTYPLQNYQKCLTLDQATPINFLSQEKIVPQSILSTLCEYANASFDKESSRAGACQLDTINSFAEFVSTKLSPYLPAINAEKDVLTHRIRQSSWKITMDEHFKGFCTSQSPSLLKSLFLVNTSLVNHSIIKNSAVDYRIQAMNTSLQADYKKEKSVSMTRFWLRVANLPGTIASNLIFASLSSIWSNASDLVLGTCNFTTGNSVTGLVFFTSQSACDKACKMITSNDNWPLTVKPPFTDATLRLVDSYKSYEALTSSLSTSKFSALFDPTFCENSHHVPVGTETGDDLMAKSIIIPPNPTYHVIPYSLSTNRSQLIALLVASISLASMFDLEAGFDLAFPPLHQLGLDQDERQHILSPQSCSDMPVEIQTLNSFVNQSDEVIMKASQTCTRGNDNDNKSNSLSIPQYQGLLVLHHIAPSHFTPSSVQYFDVNSMDINFIRQFLMVVTQYLLRVHLYCFFTATQFPNSNAMVVAVGTTGPLWMNKNSSEMASQMLECLQLLQERCYEPASTSSPSSLLSTIINEISRNSLLSDRFLTLVGKFQNEYYNGPHTDPHSHSHTSSLRSSKTLFYRSMYAYYLLQKQFSQRIFMTPFLSKSFQFSSSEEVLPRSTPLQHHVCADFLTRYVSYYVQISMEIKKDGKAQCKLCNKVFISRQLAAKHILLSGSHEKKLFDEISQAITLTFQSQTVMNNSIYLPLSLPLNTQSVRFSESDLSNVLMQVWSKQNKTKIQNNDSITSEQLNRQAIQYQYQGTVADTTIYPVYKLPLFTKK